MVVFFFNKNEDVHTERVLNFKKRRSKKPFKGEKYIPRSVGQ